MKEQIEDLTNKIKELFLWQIAVVISVVLLTLGFLGSIPFTDVNLKAGSELAAVITGIIFFIIGSVLKTRSEPPRRKKGSKKK